VCQENERAAKMTKKKSIFELIGLLFDGPTIFTEKILIFWRFFQIQKIAQKIAD